MTHNEQLFWALGYCIFILVLFLIVKKFPPKKINWWYGYRTARSMQNDEIWKVAQEYASKKSIQLALLSFIFPPLLYVTIPEYNFQWKQPVYCIRSKFRCRAEYRCERIARLYRYRSF